MNEDSPFWFVWNINGNAPRYRHESARNATAEAERLARLNPGETFIVLQSVCARRFDRMERIDLRPNVSDIPL